EKYINRRRSVSPSPEHKILLLLFCFPWPSILRFYLLRSETTDKGIYEEDLFCFSGV
ncbi:unnamed protein product, partial [Arabidopsis halleri]